MTRLRLGFAPLLAALVLAACETTDGGYVGSGYYGDDFSDPWYYGGGDWYDDDIALPPGDRPNPPPRPAHPIARPSPAPRPLPSIPSRPRPARRR